MPGHMTPSRQNAQYTLGFASNGSWHELMEIKLDNNIINIKKGQENLQFELHNWGETQEVLKEVKAFKIDTEAMAECIHLTKVFGPFNITKTYEDTFVFSKGNMSATLSKYKW